MRENRRQGEGMKSLERATLFYKPEGEVRPMRYEGG